MTNNTSPTCDHLPYEGCTLCCPDWDRAYLTIQGPFGPDSYSIRVTSITFTGVDYLVEGLRSDRDLPEVKAICPDGKVSFIWSADRIRIL